MQPSEHCTPGAHLSPGCAEKITRALHYFSIFVKQHQKTIALKKPVSILVTNDDGVEAKGIRALIDVARQLGEVTVVAPNGPRSGSGAAITMGNIVRLEKLHEEPGLSIYSCTGTPVDCVKLAVSQLFTSPPDLLLSGFNHGSNASVNVFYSGTVSAVLEGCIHGIASIGFSFLNHSSRADFNPAMPFAKQIAAQVLTSGLPAGTALNVNLPDLPNHQIKGIRVCHQTKGVWKEEFIKRQDMAGKDYFWLTGTYHNLEPDDIDSDIWALDNGYVAVVPIHTDTTNYKAINELQHLNTPPA